MSDADLLRRAAALMRERASATREPHPDAAWWYGSDGDDEDLDALTFILDDWFNTSTARADAEHIASWHPAVALAVADVLDAEANRVEENNARLTQLFGEEAEVFYDAPAAGHVTLASTYLRSPVGATT